MKLNDSFKPINETYQYLSDGQEFKNYKELCLFLKQPIAQGRNKSFQINTFNRFFEFETNGHKITITNVYYEPIEESSKGAYSMLIQKLILDILANEYKSMNHTNFIVAKSKFAMMLGLTKPEYKRFYNNKSRVILSELLDIDLDIVDEFYKMTESKLSGYIETALKSLSSKSIIDYSSNTLMVKEDNYSGIRLASSYEISLILKAEGVMLESFMTDYDKTKTDLIGRKDAMIRGRWEEFKEGSKLLISEYGLNYIDFYFRGYNINFTEDILNAQSRLDSFISNNRNEIKNELNALLSSKYKTSYQKFHDKALSSYTDDLKLIEKPSYPVKKILIRSQENYVNGGHTLINSTIDKTKNLDDYIVAREEICNEGIPF